jgi:hypothetical protein
MVQEWIASWRRRQRRRSAESMLVWCEQANIVFEACALALKQDGPPAPPDVTLNRIDWGLEHLRDLSNGVRRALTHSDRPLAHKVEQHLVLSYHLRNSALSYLIRLKAFQQADRDARTGRYEDRRLATEARRDRDRALLEALAVARRASTSLEALAPGLRARATSLAQQETPGAPWAE